MYQIVRGDSAHREYYVELLGWTQFSDIATLYDNKEYAEEVARVVGGFVISV